MVIWVDTAITRHNYGAIWNGIGAVPDVLAGKAELPMQYRVLVPWLCDFIGGDQLRTYIRIKWFSILCAVSAAFVWFLSLAISPFIAVSMLGFFFCMGSLYDYGETYWEITFFAIAFMLIGYSTWWAYAGIIVVSYLMAITKETAPFIALAALLSGQWVMAIVSGLTIASAMTMLYVKYGRRKRYTALIERYNWYRFKRNRDAGLSWVQEPYFMAAALLVGTAYLLIVNWGALTGTEMAMFVLFFAAIPITVCDEIRMWNPVVLGLIPLALK